MRLGPSRDMLYYVHPYRYYMSLEAPPFHPTITLIVCRQENQNPGYTPIDWGREEDLAIIRTGNRIPSKLWLMNRMQALLPARRIFLSPEILNKLCDDSLQMLNMSSVRRALAMVETTVEVIKQVPDQIRIISQSRPRRRR